jgi:hypothetical protein
MSLIQARLNKCAVTTGARWQVKLYNRQLNQSSSLERYQPVYNLKVQDNQVGRPHSASLFASSPSEKGLLSPQTAAMARMVWLTLGPFFPTMHKSRKSHLTVSSAIGTSKHVVHQSAKSDGPTTQEPAPHQFRKHVHQQHCPVHPCPVGLPRLDRAFTVRVGRCCHRRDEAGHASGSQPDSGGSKLLRNLGAAEPRYILEEEGELAKTACSWSNAPHKIRR